MVFTSFFIFLLFFFSSGLTFLLIPHGEIYGAISVCLVLFLGFFIAEKLFLFLAQGKRILPNHRILEDAKSRSYQFDLPTPIIFISPFLKKQFYILSSWKKRPIILFGKDIHLNLTPEEIDSLIVLALVKFKKNNVFYQTYFYFVFLVCFAPLIFLGVKFKKSSGVTISLISCFANKFNLDGEKKFLRNDSDTCKKLNTCVHLYSALFKLRETSRGKTNLVDMLLASFSLTRSVDKNNLFSFFIKDDIDKKRLSLLRMER